MPEEEILRGFARWAGEKHSRRLKVFWIHKGMINTNII